MKGKITISNIQDMNKVKNIVLGAALLLSASSMNASEISATSTFEYQTAYMFRGVQYAEGVFTPSVDFSYLNAYVGVWAALPTDDAEANEVDFYAGYALEVNEVLSADFGVTYYSYPDSSSKFLDSSVNTTEFYAGISAEALGSPSLYVYYDIDTRDLTVEASTGHSFDIYQDTTLDLGLTGGYRIMDAAGTSDYTYLILSSGVGYTFNESVSGSVSVNYSLNSENYIFDSESESSHVWLAFSLSAGF